MKKVVYRVHAFTLIELVVALSISATVIGILMISYHQLGRSNLRHQIYMIEKERFESLVVALKTDLFLYEMDAKSISDHIILNAGNQMIIYDFIDSMVVRQQLSTRDTFRIKKVSFLRKVKEEKKKIVPFYTLYAIIHRNDSIEYNFRLKSSTDIRLKSYAH